MVSNGVRFIVLAWVLAFSNWCPAQKILPARDWSDINGQTINAQIVDWDSDSITVIRPGVMTMSGKHQEFTVPLDRLCSADQAYAEKLIQIKAEYELQFNQLKLEYPTEEVMVNICKLLIKEGVVQEPHIPDDQLIRRYKKLSNSLNFNNFEYEMAYIRNSLNSEMKDYDSDTSGRGVGSIAKQYQENAKWVSVYLVPYLDSLTQVRQSYLEKLLATPAPKAKPE